MNSADPRCRVSHRYQAGGLKRLQRSTSSSDVGPLGLVNVMGTRMKTSKDVMPADVSSSNSGSSSKHSKKFYRVESHHAAPQPKVIEFSQFVAVPPRVTKIMSITSSKSGCHTCPHPTCDRYEAHRLRRCKSDVAETKTSHSTPHQDVLLKRHTVSAGIHRLRTVKNPTSWNSSQGLARESGMVARNNSHTLTHRIPSGTPSTAEDAVLSSLENLDMTSAEKVPEIPMSPPPEDSTKETADVARSLAQSSSPPGKEGGLYHLQEETESPPETRSRRIQDLEEEFQDGWEELSENMAEYVAEEDRMKESSSSSSPEPRNDRSGEDDECGEGDTEGMEDMTSARHSSQPPLDNATTEDSSALSSSSSQQQQLSWQRKTGAGRTLRKREGKERQKGEEEEEEEEGESLQLETEEEDAVYKDEDSPETSGKSADKKLPSLLNIKLESYQRKLNKTGNQLSTNEEEQNSKYGQYWRHMKYFDPAEAAERRKKKLMDKMKSKKLSKFHRKDKEGPHFEDYGFLSKYCIFNKENWDMYRRIFEVGDADKKGWLTTEEMLLALKSVNNQLRASEEEYLCQIIELTGYSVGDGADFTLFAVVAALSLKITALDDWMKNMVDTLDYQLLDLKAFKSRTLWECNVDPETNKISLDQLCVDLQAGGVSESHEDEVRTRLGHLTALDLLDFLTYIPLFVMIHNSVVDNPLDSARSK